MTKVLPTGLSKRDLLDIEPFDYNDALASNEGSDGGVMQITDVTRDLLAAADPEAGIVTEHSLIMAAYPESIPICTDAFMNVSRDHYALPWLVREIVQNFVDENKDHPASLDGVDFRHEVEDGVHSFTITGDWPFTKPTGLISLHSGKSKTDKKKAGGNGIGLKQTVLRFLRDYGVEEFNVVGEGWKVSYRIAKSGEANAKLQELGVKEIDADPIENDWLLATVEKSSNHGRCVYEIKTADQDVAAALDDFPNLGVSAENDHLKNPNYENSHGSFKWIPFDPTLALDGQQEMKIPRGRIFINGQVMNYRDKGSSAGTYWDGPEMVNINLQDLDYDMSMDRPPVTANDLYKYVVEMVNEMDRQTLVKQLKQSEYIWGQIDDPEYIGHSSAAFVLIRSFVHRLEWNIEPGGRRSYYNWEDFKADFGENYLYRDKSLSTEEETQIKEKGYVLCPKYFERLGLPRASGKLDAMKQARKERPKVPDMRWQAQSEGMQVGFEVPEIKSESEFFPYFIQRFSKRIQGMEVQDEGKGQILIDMPMDFDEKLFYQQMISAPKDKDAMDMYALRGVVNYALKTGIFEEVVISNGKLFITFALSINADTGEEKFLTKVTEGAIPPGLYASVSEKAWTKCLEAFKVKNLEQVIARRKAKPRIEKAERRVLARPNYWMGRLTRSFALAFGVFGIWWCANNFDYLAGHAKQLSSVFSDSRSNSGSAGPSETEKYREWINGGKHYGYKKKERPSKRDLSTLLSDYDNSKVKSSSSHEPPSEPAENLGASGHDVVDNFEIVQSPTANQKKQLELFRDYIYLTTGIDVENNLFIYEGDGAYGINMGGQAIGLHVSLLDVEFDEALSTFVHEVAHNKHLDHGLGFRRLNSILQVAIHDTVSGIAQKLDAGEELSQDEQTIVHTEAIWNSLKAN